MLDLKPITIQDKAVFDRFLGAAGRQASEYTFTNLFVWREHYGFRYTLLRGFLVVIAEGEGEPFALFPIGPYANSAEELSDCIDELGKYFASKRLSLRFSRVEEEDLSVLLKTDIPFQAFRDPANDDYLYCTSSLVSLAGRKYDGKRNHIHRLTESHDVVYEPITPNNLMDVKLVIEEWFRQRRHTEDNIDPEYTACLELINHYEILHCRGGLLYVDGLPAAMTIGERMDHETAVIHFEKAVKEIDGVYPYINQCFVRNEWGDTQMINREQDLGLSGLRRSKLSYHPVKMVDKYTVSF